MSDKYFMVIKEVRYIVKADSNFEAQRADEKIKVVEESLHSYELFDSEIEQYLGDSHER
jgi:hypothetical protein